MPTDNGYPSNNKAYSSQAEYYNDLYSRKHNAYYNRLPPAANQVNADDVSPATTNDDDDYDDQQTDKPVPINSGNQQQLSNYDNYNNLLNSNFLLNENRVKKKRRIRRPCIPIQSFNSQLFTNRLKREAGNEREDGKTLNYLLGGYGGGYGPFGYPQGGGYRPSYQGGYGDNVKPSYDSGSDTGASQFGQVQYQPYGGYPCIPVSYGRPPGSGLFGNRPGLFGGGGLLGGGGPLGGGFIGQGGLLDFAGPGPLSPSGVYQGSGSYPQTVIINRPPLFGLPSYNGPQGGSQGSQSSPGSSGNYDPSNGGGQGGTNFWGSVVNKLQEFVSENLLGVHQFIASGTS